MDYDIIFDALIKTASIIYAVSVFVLLILNMNLIIGGFCNDEETQVHVEQMVSILKIRSINKPRTYGLLCKHPKEMFWSSFIFGLFTPVINTLSLYTVYKFLTLSKKQ